MSALRRFFCEPDEIAGECITLSKEESTHIRTVLRLEEGDEVELLDGSGMVYRGNLSLDGKKVQVQITERHQEKENRGASLWVGQALLKGQKSDEVLPKLTELGVDHFAPFESWRCQGRLDGARKAKKKARWERIMTESCKQCLRPRKMEIGDIEDYARLLEGLGAPTENELRIFFWEEESKQMFRQLSFEKNLRTVRILLGPEGGFTEEEAELALAAGFVSVSLGERILKADTAAVSVAALVQYAAGNFG